MIDIIKQKNRLVTVLDSIEAERHLATFKTENYTNPNC